MSGRPSPDALDAELTHRVEEQARIADALLELERHPGHRLLATAALTGVTAVPVGGRAGASRVAVGRPRHAPRRRRRRLRRPHPPSTAGRARVGGAARAARGRGPRPACRRGSALAESVTLGELAARMDGRLREVAGVLEAAETVHLAALAGLGPLAERVRDAQARARELLEPDDPDGAALAALASRGRRPARHLHERSAFAPGPAAARPRRRSRRRPGTARTAVSTRSRPAWRSGRQPATRGRIGAARSPMRSRRSTRCATREAHARRAALDRVAGVGLRGSAGPAARAAPPARRAARAATGRGVPRRVAPPRRGRRHCVGRRAHRHRPRDRADRPARRARGAVRAPTGRRRCGSGRPTTRGSSRSPTQIRGLLATPRTDLPALTRALVAYQERVNEAEGRPA